MPRGLEEYVLVSCRQMQQPMPVLPTPSLLGLMDTAMFPSNDQAPNIPSHESRASCQCLPCLVLPISPPLHPCSGQELLAPSPAPPPWPFRKPSIHLYRLEYLRMRVQTGKSGAVQACRRKNSTPELQNLYLDSSTCTAVCFYLRLCTLVHECSPT